MDKTTYYNLSTFHSSTDWIEIFEEYMNETSGNFDIIDTELNRVENQSNMLKTGWDEFQTFPILTFDDITRTLTIEGSGATYWLNNVHHSIDAEIQVQIDAIEGIHFIYFDSSGIQHSTSVWPFNYSVCPVTAFYWDNTNLKHIGISYEFHKWNMDPNLHLYLHETRGTSYGDGLGLTEISPTTLRIATGSVFDEDIELKVGDNVGSTQILNPLNAPILYREGANGNIRDFPASSDLCYLNPGPYINVNNGGIWELEELSNNKYFVYWLLATNIRETPIILVPGQVSGATQNVADELNTLAGMSFGSIRLAEFVVLSRIMMVSSPTTYQIIQIDDYRTSREESSVPAPAEGTSSIMDIVADIGIRDSIIASSGKLVHVVDASGDPDIYIGWAQYIYDGAQWMRTNEDDANTTFGTFYQLQADDYLMETTGINTFVGNKIGLTLTQGPVAGGLSLNVGLGRLEHVGKSMMLAFNATAAIAEPSVPNMEIHFVLFKNGVQVIPSMSHALIESSGGATTIDAAAAVSVEDGDYLEVFCSTDKTNGDFWVHEMQLQFIEVPQ